MPVLKTIAFNEQLGWTHTVNTIDASDRYELTLQQGGYLLDGKSVPFQEKRVPLKVLQKMARFTAGY
jgi:acyl-homoserine-lactone acylase